MLGDKNKILNNPELLRREAAIEPIKKKKGWLFKLILILAIIWLIYYLWKNPEIIRDPVNKFFGRFS